MTNGIIDHAPSFKLGYKENDAPPAADMSILKKRYYKATELNATQQAANSKMRKVLEEKNGEIEHLSFFRKVCYNLWQQGLMSEACELVAKSATKMTDAQFQELKKSAQSNKVPSLKQMEE